MNSTGNLPRRRSDCERPTVGHVEDIYRHADLLRATVAGYLAKVGDKAPAA